MTLFTNVILILAVNLFALRTIPNKTQHRTGGVKIGFKLATELFPYNVSNNGTIIGHIIDCARLCNKYLYCTTFSYNDATTECRFVVGMNATSDPAALVVQKMRQQFIHVFITLQVDSDFNTYDIVEL